jgi:hypothetical protein
VNYAIQIAAGLFYFILFAGRLIRISIEIIPPKEFLFHLEEAFYINEGLVVKAL